MKNYGFVSREVTNNPAISARAKGVYCYIASFSGDTGGCTLDVDTVLVHLKIRAGELYVRLRELFENDAIYKFSLDTDKLYCKLEEN